jgi:hypothetical protein
MTVRKLWAFGLIVVLAGCSGGRGSLGNLNPFNWFQGNGAGNQVETLAPRRGYPTPVETRPLVDQITGLSAEPTPTGVIIRATALPPTQGYYAAELVLSGTTADGTLTLDFRAHPPQTAQPAGAPYLRELVAAIFLNNNQRRGLRVVRVRGARNARSIHP